ncbi:MAG: threonine/serine dehydratase [Pirellulaceae bacterium]|nr:threonine/serine dehydratase [Pirellulaceae bacterium]
MLNADLVRAAQENIRPWVHRTPLIRSSSLSERWGANVFLKLECWQKTGSFKPRGAFNKLLSLDAQQRAHGVVGVSGGNHAQGLAYAARALGISAVICMPETTPENYLSATRGYGAEIRLFPTIHAAFAAAEQIQREGRVYVHPFDDPLLAAGQGTVGLEILEDVPDITHCYVSIGGGGLIVGIGAALKEHSTAVASKGKLPRLIGVETVGADVMAQSVAAQQLIELPAITSIARTLGAPRACRLTFELVRQWVDELVVVPDADCVRELFYLLERAKILVEPAAACCLAAAHQHHNQFQPDDNVVILLCGGNVAASDLCRWLHDFR